MAEAPDLRVSDADRDEVAREIREHFAAGRLSDDELAERVHRAYAAKTQSELQEVRADLPKLPAAHAAELQVRRAQLQRRFVQQLGGSLIPFVVCVVIWVASGGGNFWPIWAALPAAITLVRVGWSLYGPDADLDRVERELEHRGRRRYRDNHREQLRHELRTREIERRTKRRY